MGGRGAFSGGTLQDGSFREYHQVGWAGDIKVIAKENGNISKNLPVRSNTPNRTYGILDKDGKPKQIGIYKDNYLVTTIDFPDKHKNYFHANDWGVVGYDEKGAISARIGERKTLTEHEKKLVSDFMKEYNGGK